MNKQKAREILDGGKTNDLKKAGSLIKDPSVVLEFFFDGDAFHTSFGNFGLDETDLDYGVHRAKGVSLSQKEAFYEDHTVEVDVYTMDGDEVDVDRYQATPDSWEEQ